MAKENPNISKAEVAPSATRVEAARSPQEGSHSSPSPGEHSASKAPQTGTQVAPSSSHALPAALDPVLSGRGVDMGRSGDRIVEVEPRIGRPVQPLAPEDGGPRVMPIDPNLPAPIRPRVMGGLLFVNDAVAPGSTPLTPDHQNPLATKEEHDLSADKAARDAEVERVMRERGLRDRDLRNRRV